MRDAESEVYTKYLTDSDAILVITYLAFINCFLFSSASYC